jgi:hypothetical protein
MVVVGLAAWLIESVRSGENNCATGRAAAMKVLVSHLTRSGYRAYAVALVCFVLPLTPLIVFNLRTDGTLTSIFGNLGQSYYGVNNRAYLHNLYTRWTQLLALLRGDFLWYLGQAFGTLEAPGIFSGVLAAGWLAGLVSFIRSRRQKVDLSIDPLAVFFAPALLALIVLQSAFTVSSLFITHYILLLPLIPLSAGVAVAVIRQALVPHPASGEAKPPASRGDVAQNVATAAPTRRATASGIARMALLLPVLAAVLFWIHGDLVNTVKYHWALTVSGGAGDHSDAINKLASFLVLREPAAPLALDWGMDAPIRFLTSGHVNPVEVFGYDSLQKPDAGFVDRLAPFLDNPDNLYLAHDPQNTVFKGRVEALKKLAKKRGQVLEEVSQFHDRSGKPLFVVYRVVKKTS